LTLQSNPFQSLSTQTWYYWTIGLILQYPKQQSVSVPIAVHLFRTQWSENETIWSCK
jgi:hypothetical protein